jgi:EAL domain-containing protein (putative c-di-GMP-specific phosphodiesterase class I)
MTHIPVFDAAQLMRSVEPRLPDLTMTRLEASARLRFTVAQALTQGRLIFHHQPVVQARAPHAVAFHEALARLRLPGGQILPAGAFMPAVEAGGLGRAVDRLALAHALSALAADPGLRLSINMSPRSMGDEDWLAILAAAHRGGAGVCGRLIIEITEEAALAEADQTIEFMDYVRRMGPSFALDDFGAGATGFRHFSRFRFDMVKIDGAFVQEVHANRDSQVLLECLVRLARHFDMLCIAERVEAEADAAWLREAGIDCLQGYLYGRPAPMVRPGDAPSRREAC